MMKRHFRSFVSKYIRAESQLLCSYATPVKSTHAHVKSDLVITNPHVNKTLGWHLSHMTREMPFSNSIRSKSQRSTFSNALLKKHVEALACGLVEMGLRPGDTLGVIQDHAVEQMILQLAAAKIGAILVRFSPSSDRELDRYINLYRFRMIVTPTRSGKVNLLDDLFPSLIPELEKLSTDGVPFKARRYPFLRQILVSDPGMPRELLSAGVVPIHDILLYGPFGYYENPLRRLSLHIDASRPALILANQTPLDLLDGSNMPVYSQENLLNTGALVAEKVGLAPGDRAVLATRFSAPFGAVVAPFACLSSRSQLVFPPFHLSEEDILSTAAEEEATVLFMDFDIASKVAASTATSSARALRSVVIEAPLGEDTTSLVASLKSKLNVDNVHVAIMNPRSLLMFDGEYVPTELKIESDTKSAHIVEVDTFGKLKLSGPTVASHVWNELGALPSRDEDGFVTLQGFFKMSPSHTLSQ